MVKKSMFFHVFKKDEKTCIYNSLTMQCLYTTSSIYDKWNKEFEMNSEFSKESDELQESLKSLKLIIPDEYDENKLLERIRKALFTGPSVQVMVLHMKDYCNLRCKYCFVEGTYPATYKKKMMSFETARAAIDKFIKMLEGSYNPENGNPTIEFYGGEPLANWSVVKQALEYIKDYESKDNSFHFDKVLITNGTLMTEEIAAELSKFDILASVSIDGIKEVHDFNRIDENGNGSFDKAVQGYKLLKKYGIQTGISAVLTKEGVPHALDSFHYFVDELKAEGLGINHVSVIPNLTYYDPAYEDAYADQILKIQDEIQDNDLNIYERRMNHKINCFLNNHLIANDCTGCGQQMSVNTDGKIGICQGYIGTGKTFEHTVFEEVFNPNENEVFKEWSTRSTLRMEKCIHCPALATCGGGCPRNADMINGSIWKPDTAFCHFALKAQEWMIWRNEKNG